MLVSYITAALYIMSSRSDSELRRTGLAQPTAILKHSQSQTIDLRIDSGALQTLLINKHAPGSGIIYGSHNNNCVVIVCFEVWAVGGSSSCTLEFDHKVRVLR